MNRIPVLIGAVGAALGFLYWLLHRGGESATRRLDGSWFFHPRPTFPAIQIFFIAIGVSVMVSAVLDWDSPDDIGLVLFGLLFIGVTLRWWAKGLVVDSEGMREYRLWGVGYEVKWSEYLRREFKRASHNSSSGHRFITTRSNMFVWEAAYDTDRLVELVDEISGKPYTE